MLGEDDDGDRSWAAVSKRTRHDGPAPAAGVEVGADVVVAAGEMAKEGVPKQPTRQQSSRWIGWLFMNYKQVEDDRKSRCFVESKE